MDITSEIFDIIGNTPKDYNTLPDADKQNVLNQIDKKWDELPEVKISVNEKDILALFLFPEYIQLRQFEPAEKWINIYLYDKQDDYAQQGLNKGILNFEKRNYEEALKFFTMAFDDSKERIFKGKNPKYLDFYKNPEKYIK